MTAPVLAAFFNNYRFLFTKVGMCMSGAVYDYNGCRCSFIRLEASDVFTFQIEQALVVIVREYEDGKHVSTHVRNKLVVKKWELDKVRDWFYGLEKHVEPEKRGFIYRITLPFADYVGYADEDGFRLGKPSDWLKGNVDKNNYELLLISQDHEAVPLYRFDPYKQYYSWRISFSQKKDYEAFQLHHLFGAFY